MADAIYKVLNNITDELNNDWNEIKTNWPNNFACSGLKSEESIEVM